MSQTPRKRFGQHFLHDRDVIKRIAAAIAPRPDDTLVEIGPGEGALTAALLRRLAHLHAVELDRDLVPRLRARFGAALSVTQADALHFDFAALAPPQGDLRIAGNLPYNISTPLIFHLLDSTAQIRDMTFLLQREVVERLAAAPGGKDYGRLSVMVQYRCAVDRLFRVGPGAFSPPPKVDSAVVRLRPYRVPPHPAQDEAHFARLVAHAFTQRRKTLGRSLRTLLTPAQFAVAGIDPMRRAETLSVAEFAALSDAAGIPADRRGLT
ncbi:16S rRNA (adenine(1518)-N(6)/adenine(1519)-N(6))-dimethyltransferase RsmA [Acidihalobacter ferrooxydans]|uniref:Ribosomal RNA small subunit methyltransferase A n=1 Tax=Acidihalobacter ferrooxydans TaxID=1765967 RepID=A0A1P8UK24_9GAMM|nr:16S rRNA (adenine(1518)-N(6)/adenine(1519)-N(6))-dimethyltransferase RsmA [Acidihalobacter ferrooxydans]APZ44122.1 16S rRNA (adenine(1518)-N(6)/adenine(1519)-N(6))-dimethyltransferase [Acidihalobacter ferrooxydans]